MRSLIPLRLFKKMNMPMFSLLILDKLKEINDHYGHEGGDQALRMAAEILSTVFHQDVVGRIGGDEFVVLLKPAHVAFLQNIDVAIKQATVNLSLIYRYPFKVSISYGVSVFDHQTSKRLQENSR